MIYAQVYPLLNCKPYIVAHYIPRYECCSFCTAILSLVLFLFFSPKVPCLRTQKTTSVILKYRCCSDESLHLNGHTLEPHPQTTKSCKVLEEKNGKNNSLKRSGNKMTAFHSFPGRNLKRKQISTCREISNHSGYLTPF